MAEITELQLQRLHSAAEEIQRVVNEIRTANEWDVPETTLLVVRRAAVSTPRAGGSAVDDCVVVDCEPE